MIQLPISCKGLITLVMTCGLATPIVAHPDIKSSPVKVSSVEATPRIALPDSMYRLANAENDLNGLVTQLKKEGFDIKELLADPRFKLYDGIADRFRESAERKTPTLEAYKDILAFEDKSQQIRIFIDEHHDQLQKASQKYGISKYVIAAIIGIESNFGKHVGTYNPFNTYVSMYAENYRQDFAEAQLKELLKFVQRNNIDVFELKSSYAGAMAYCQFIPYSLNKWFVGKDIFNMDNNIMSVANYLAHFKERSNDIETAVLRYNPSSLYTRTVLDLAEMAEQHYRSE